MCDRNQLSTILREFAELARETFGEKLKQIVLFGSYARGDYDEESDVDIALLVDVPKPQEQELRDAVLKILSEIDEKNGYCVLISPIIISYPFFEEWKDSIPFYRNVNKEGVRLVA